MFHFDEITNSRAESIVTVKVQGSNFSAVSSLNAAFTLKLRKYKELYFILQISEIKKHVKVAFSQKYLYYLILSSLGFALLIAKIVNFELNMFKRLLIDNPLIHLPKKTRNREPENSSGDYDMQPPLNNEYPPKFNNKSKYQKNSTKRSRSRSSSNVKNSPMLTNNSLDITNKNRFSLDIINLKIITELMNKGDIKSSEIAAKLKVPLSTIQRRRTRIEKSLLKKQYKMDLTVLGYRSALIFVDVQRGKAKQTGEELLKRFEKNIVSASTRINSNNNLCLEVVYGSSDDLHYLIEEIKSLPVAAKVDWSEQVMVIGDNLAKIIKTNLTDKLEEMQSPKISV